VVESEPERRHTNFLSWLANKFARPVFTSGLSRADYSIHMHRVADGLNKIGRATALAPKSQRSAPNEE
jgi:hypothetical protein